MSNEKLLQQLTEKRDIILNRRKTIRRYGGSQLLRIRKRINKLKFPENYPQERVITW